MKALAHKKVENLKRELAALPEDERAYECYHACFDDEILRLAVLNDPALRELTWDVAGEGTTVAHMLAQGHYDAALRALDMPEVRRLRTASGTTVAHHAAQEHELAALKALGIPAVRELKDDWGDTVASTAVMFHGLAAMVALDNPGARTLRGPEQITVAHICVIHHRTAALKALEMPEVRNLTDKGGLARLVKQEDFLQKWNRYSWAMPSGRHTPQRTVAEAAAFAHPVACVWGNVLGVVGHTRTGVRGLPRSAVEVARDRQEFGSLCRTLAEKDVDAVLDLLEHTSFAARLDTAGWAALLAAPSPELRAEVSRRVAGRRRSARRAS